MGFTASCVLQLTHAAITVTSSLITAVNIQLVKHSLSLQTAVQFKFADNISFAEFHFRFNFHIIL